MKLVTFEANGKQGSGVVLGDAVIDFATAFTWFERDSGRPSDTAHMLDRYGAGILGFIEHAKDARPAADEIVRRFEAKRTPASFDGRPFARPLGSVALSSPLPRPPSMRDGYAFRQHVETARRNRGLEMIPEFDQFPVFYFSNHQAVIGPGDLRAQRLHLDRLDFELEAAIVVGQRGRNVPASQADALIFGFTIMNDFSARALQMEEMKLSLGPAKGKDFATALGPWLVTIDELAPRSSPTPNGARWDLAMRAFVNGAQMSEGNVKDMSWTFAQILERASYGATLHPRDVIGSGTCGTGCFLELNGSKVTNNQWLQPGDTIALEIDGLGRLENRVVENAGAPEIG